MILFLLQEPRRASAKILGDPSGHQGAPTPRCGGVGALGHGPVLFLLLEALLLHEHAEGVVQAVLGYEHLPLVVQLGSCCLVLRGRRLPLDIGLPRQDRLGTDLLRRRLHLIGLLCRHLGCLGCGRRGSRGLRLAPHCGRYASAIASLRRRQAPLRALLLELLAALRRLVVSPCLRELLGGEWLAGTWLR